MPREVFLSSRCLLRVMRGLSEAKRGRLEGNSEGISRISPSRCALKKSDRSLVALGKRRNSSAWKLQRTNSSMKRIRLPSPPAPHWRGYISSGACGSGILQAELVHLVATEDLPLRTRQSLRTRHAMANTRWVTIQRICQHILISSAFPRQCKRISLA